MRLIEADKQEIIIEELENICMNNEYVLELLAELKNQPTVDAEPVRHGKWIETEDNITFDTMYKCSECGEEFMLIDGTPTQNLYNYCPNCGAKMGESDNE